MKKLYRLFRRGRRYYVEHVETRRQTSLGTMNISVDALIRIAKALGVRLRDLVADV